MDFTKKLIYYDCEEMLITIILANCSCCTITISFSVYTVFFFENLPRGGQNGNFWFYGGGGGQSELGV